MTPEELEAKRGLIAAFFDDLESKYEFLKTLYAQSRYDEARMLCALYLDGLGNWLSPNSGETSRNFAKVLVDHGGERDLGLILPHWLLKRIPFKSSPSGAEQPIRTGLSRYGDDVALEQAHLVEELGTQVSDDHLRWLHQHLWRGTLAAIVHERFRSPNVHWLGSMDGLAFSRTRFNGAPLQDIDFEVLYRALGRIISYARALSQETDKWFGHR